MFAKLVKKTETKRHFSSAARMHRMRHHRPRQDRPTMAVVTRIRTQAVGTWPFSALGSVFTA